MLARLWHEPRLRFAALTLPGALFVLVFLLVPLITIVVFSFWRTERYEMIVDWNLDNYATILGDPTYLTFLGRSLVMALAVSLICLVYAYPVAYLIAKHGGRYRLILVLLTAAPFLTGIILRVTAIQHILGPIGLVNMALTTFGMAPIKVLMYSNVASAIGLIYLWIPFMVLAIYLSLLNFNFELLEVAKVCGAKPWSATGRSRSRSTRSARSSTTAATTTAGSSTRTPASASGPSPSAAPTGPAAPARTGWRGLRWSCPPDAMPLST